MPDHEIQNQDNSSDESLADIAKHRGGKLAPDQFKRAIAFDFEGVGVAPGNHGDLPAPSLIGYRCDGNTSYFLVDPALKLLARGRKGLERDCEYRPLDQALESIVDKAREEERLILVFSQHEGRMIEHHAPGLVQKYAEVLADVKPLMEEGFRLRNRRSPQRSENETTLSSLAGQWKPSLVEKQQPVEVGKSIRDLRSALEGKSLLNQLSELWRNRFQDLLHYNDSCL